MTSDKVREWQSILKKIEDSVSDLLWNQHVFREFMEIVETNPEIPENNYFIIWVWQNYLYNAAIAVRRLRDKNKRSIYEPKISPSVKLKKSKFNTEKTDMNTFAF